MALVDVSITVITLIFKAFLVDSTMDVLSAYLKKGGIKDLLAFFPPNKREGKHLEEHFRKEGTPQVADWWAKKQYAVLKEEMIKDLRELSEREDTPPAEVSSPHPLDPVRPKYFQICRQIHQSLGYRCTGGGFHYPGHG